MSFWNFFKKKTPDENEGQPIPSTGEWIFQLLDPDTGDRSPAFKANPDDMFSALKSMVEESDDEARSRRTLIFPIIKVGEHDYSQAPPVSVAALIDIKENVEWKEDPQDAGEDSTAA